VGCITWGVLFHNNSYVLSRKKRVEIDPTYLKYKEIALDGIRQNANK
jgi:hypothetical protein